MFRAKVMGGTTPQRVVLIGFLFSEVDELLACPVQDTADGSQLLSGLLAEFPGGGDDIGNIAFVATEQGMYRQKVTVMHGGNEVTASVCGLDVRTLKALRAGNMVTTPYRPWLIMIARETALQLATFINALIPQLDRAVDALERRSKPNIPEPSLN